MKKIKIINTGGTFNKRYNSFNGNLDVPSDNKAIKKILKEVLRTDKLPSIEGVIYKDSLEINKEDRQILVDKILEIKEEKILIIHGTDTMEKTAKFLSKFVQNKQIILTGAMIPFSINSIEAVGNLMQGYGFLQGNNINGIYISMNGYVREYTNITKNKQLGRFECR